MKFLFPEEERLINTLFANKNFGEKLRAAVEKIYIHLPQELFHEKYDPAVVEEFLKELVKDSQKLGLEQYYAHVAEDDTIHTIEKKCAAPHELQESIFKSLGSGGLTKLIEDLLRKMLASGFTENEIQNLVELIEARNKLRQAEEKFLEASFRRYIEKQISLYK
ncbi:hypothetical protein HYW83_05720 [Candidatus Peregrinibacteria bacterium]|nr:hypothetical protein [Candidatus Peregrinibacteria bacterium]